MEQKIIVRKKLAHHFGSLLAVCLFAVALWALHHELKVYEIQDILHSLKKLPAASLLIAVFLMILDYLIMTGYDFFALRYIKHKLHYRKIALVSFVGYAFSNNIGLSMVAGGSVRYRLYSAWGLSGLEIAELVGFCSLSLWLGFLALGGTVFLFEPMVIPKALHLPFNSVRPLGAGFVLLVFAYFLFCFLRKNPLKIGGWTFTLPSTRLFVSQMAVAVLDWGLAGSVLYALLPVIHGLSFGGFMGIFLLAQLAGLLSQVPGGLGVFETIIILLLSSHLQGPAVIGALLAYRCIYYVLPLLSAALLLAGEEVLLRKGKLERAAQTIGRWVSIAIPQVLAVSVFVAGIILLFSGATPGIRDRVAWIGHFFPLLVVESSHFLGTLVGVILLILARALQKRLDGAYMLAIIFLGAGILFSLLKGLDYEEALILSFILLAFLPCRPYFYRKSSLLHEDIGPAWIVAIFLVIICSVWLGMFSFKHQEYSSHLWWRFTLYGSASRFLRATVGGIGLVLFLAVARLLSSRPPRAARDFSEELRDIERIVKASRKCRSNLAFLGDKNFLFGQEKESFIMYKVEGRSWVALGDPVGDENEWAELIWNFREMSDRYDGWTVFYQVDYDKLYLYLDLGLNSLKLGEEARVSLEEFSLSGHGRRSFRNTLHKLGREGYVFDVVQHEDVPGMLPEFKAVSEAWLAGKHTREKGFSLGFFNEDYLKRFPAGIVRKGEKIIAFANILLGAKKEEVSVDLMRYLPEARRSVMDYLFIQLMLWGKQEHYGWFNLGMAPLFGLQEHRLAPLWDRTGTFLFRHGEHFYNFQGLREYKEKFGPVWTPKYLAVPGGFSLPRILVNVASLISGGLKGVVSK
jgi:phosphatidylglycerol lysyltransferase